MNNRICKWIAAILLCLLLLPMSSIAENSHMIVHLAQESPRPALNTDSLFEVHIIKADSSDSMLLRAGGKTMLVDSSTGTRAHLVINYLTKLGITELDYAFVTHTHSDHMGGFPFIMK